MVSVSKLPFSSPPETLCLLRLSALGDITHTLPVFHTIRHAWPQTKITWVIGKIEYELVKDLEGVEFIVFDKKTGLTGYKNLHTQIKNKKFDVLLHMQMSFRSSLASLLIKSNIKLGFDRERAKDLQWLFTNHKIKYKPLQHVIDSFFCFTEALGIKEKLYRWDIPIPESAQQFADHYIKDKATLIISPCSSKSYRNWDNHRYAEIADLAITEYGMQVILTGGPTTIEKEAGDFIVKHTKNSLVNLIGKTNIKELLAILDKATAVLAPDSGPAHFATAVNTPVIGLYACTNPDRARPYLSEQWVVNRYADAIQKKYKKSVNEIPWGSRVRDVNTMNLITYDDVSKKLNQLLQYYDK